MGVVLTTASTGFDWATLDLSSITTSYFAAVPAVIGVVLGLVAFRKAYGFIMSQIKRA